jgi:hypothetical protein
MVPQMNGIFDAAPEWREAAATPGCRPMRL